MGEWVKSVVGAIVTLSVLAACGHDVKLDQLTTKNLIPEQVAIDDSSLPRENRALFDRFVQRVNIGSMKITDKETVGQAIALEQAAEAADAANAKAEADRIAQQQAQEAAAAAQAAEQQRQDQAKLASAVQAGLTPDGKGVEIHNVSGQQIYCYEGYVDVKNADDSREAKAWFMYRSDDGLGVNNDVTVPLSSVDGADLSGYPAESLSKVLVPVSVRFTQYGSGIEAPSQFGHC